jgi:hypothetical protein
MAVLGAAAAALALSNRTCAIEEILRFKPFSALKRGDWNLQGRDYDLVFTNAYHADDPLA